MEASFYQELFKFLIFTEMQSLFPSLPRNAGPAALLQFKAGKCNMTQQPNGKYLVSPDLRKGTLTLVRGTDGVLHVKWTDRGSNVVVDDIIVFPNETEFKKVKTGVDADRVYVLKWKTNAAGANVNRRYIFWMQLKDSSLDEENVKKVNEELNRTAPAVSAQQSQWMQMMGLAPPGRNAAPSAAAPVSSAATTAPATMNMDFASLLSGLPAAPATTTAAATLPPAAPAMNSRTSLQSLLSSEAVTNSGIFDDEQGKFKLYFVQTCWMIYAFMCFFFLQRLVAWFRIYRKLNNLLVWMHCAPLCIHHSCNKPWMHWQKL